MAEFWRSVKRWLLTNDWALTVLAVLTAIYGCVVVRSATLSFGTERYFIIQSVSALVGLGGAVVLSCIDYEFLCRFRWVWILLAAGATVFTILFGTGPTGESNRNWINLGFISIQPSEFVKLLYIVIFAAALEQVKEKLNSWRGILFWGIHAAVICGLILMQGDLGTGLVFFFITVFMLFAAGLKFRFFIGGAAAVVAVFPYIWNNLLAEYMKNRILAGFNPEVDPLGAGYQAIRSKIMIGSGQLSGAGLGNGFYTQNELLPAKHTDFIFAVVGEELGLIGCAAVLLLLIAVLGRVLWVARTARADEGYLICMGVFGMLFAQIFENLGMCMGFLPVVGITLPFFSYGGSSMLSVMFAMGLVMGVYRKRYKNIYERILD